MLEATVIDVSPRPPNGVRTPFDTQVAELQVAAGGDQLGFTLVLTGFSSDAGAPVRLVAELRQHRPNSLVVVEHSNPPGHARVVTDRPLGPRDLFMVAAGVAVIKYSWAWDESPSIVVTVNDVDVVVEVRHQEGKAFVAR